MLSSKGWKGITAGIGMMLFAVVGGVLGVVGFESEISLGLAQAVTMFLGGLGVLGIRVALTPPA